MTDLARVLAVAADRGDGAAPRCGLWLVAWTAFAPIAAGAALAILLCVGPA